MREAAWKNHNQSSGALPSATRRDNTPAGRRPLLRSSPRAGKVAILPEVLPRMPNKPAEAAADPVLVEATRSDMVESRHRGAVAVIDAAGNIALALGEIERPVFARSAIKPLQALPLIESGAADRF